MDYCTNNKISLKEKGLLVIFDDAEEPLSVTEIMEMCRDGITAVSNCLRGLMSRGIVEMITERGDRGRVLKVVYRRVK